MKKELFSIIAIVVPIVVAIVSVILDKYSWYWPFIVFAVLFFAFYLYELFSETSDRLPSLSLGTFILITWFYLIVTIIMAGFEYGSYGLFCAMLSFIAVTICLIVEKQKQALAIVCIFNLGCFLGGFMTSLLAGT